MVTGRGGTRWAAADAETLADIWFLQQQREKERTEGKRPGGDAGAQSRADGGLPSPGAAPSCLSACAPSRPPACLPALLAEVASSV